jgi:tripartite-type tricarboxylate transporter receptor subunit TctC
MRARQRPLSVAAVATILVSAALAVLPEFSLAQQATSTGSGQAFPTRPLRLVASTQPGSQPDSIARLITQKMSEHWGKPIIMDNRPGGGGTLASNVVAKAAPDGHTLMYVLPNFVINPALHPTMPHASLKEFVGIAQIGFSTNILVATPALGVKSAKDLIAAAKAQPGKIIFGSSATGTAGHLSGARFNHIAGIKVIHVAMKGGPEASIEILAGRTHYTVATLGVALPFIKEGKMVALAVTTPQRTPVLPEVPSLAEIQPEFRQSDTSHGLVAPAGTPRAIVDQISRETARVLDLADVKERLHAIGYVIAPTTPEGYDKILREQLDTMVTLIIAAGLRAK